MGSPWAPAMTQATGKNDGQTVLKSGNTGHLHVVSCAQLAKQLDLREDIG